MDQEDGAPGLDEGDGREVADVQVADFVLVGGCGVEVWVVLQDGEDSVDEDCDAQGSDNNNEEPEDTEEEGACCVAEGVNEDLVAVEGEAGFLDLGSSVNSHSWVLMFCRSLTSQKKSAKALAAALLWMAWSV